MDIWDLGDIGDDCHPGVGNVEAISLGDPKAGEDFGIFIAILKRCDLHEMERQVGIVKDASPGMDQGSLLVRVGQSFAMVRFT